MKGKIVVSADLATSAGGDGGNNGTGTSPTGANLGNSAVQKRGMMDHAVIIVVFVCLVFVY